MRGQPNDNIPVDEAKQVLEKALTIMTRNHIRTHYCSNGTIGNILRKKHHTVDHTTISRLRQAIHDWEGTFGPADPLYPIVIVWLHDTMSLSFHWIGRLFGVSQVDIFRLYCRWYGFAYGHGQGPIVWPEATR